MIVRQVSKDAEGSQQVAELQATQEAKEALLREQERKNEELTASLEAVQQEVGEVCNTLAKNHATICCTSTTRGRVSQERRKIQSGLVSLMRGTKSSQRGGATSTKSRLCKGGMSPQMNQEVGIEPDSPSGGRHIASGHREAESPVDGEKNQELLLVFPVADG
ncbi:hypothetical protein R1flu_017140 [Riccia fluitans]|uniref:Uncharacterized protein n=1 Tax=Riccia fluitans TaxID=41844 RepID=A0ABD1YRV9_9MARC